VNVWNGGEPRLLPEVNNRFRYKSPLTIQRRSGILTGWLFTADREREFNE
jgi:hypothetical protein